MSAGEQVRALAESGTPGPWGVDPDRWAPPGWEPDMGYLRVVAGEPNKISGIRQPIVSTNGALHRSNRDRGNYADAAKIVAAVNALGPLADLIEAIDMYGALPAKPAQWEGVLIEGAIFAARDALVAALGVES